MTFKAWADEHPNWLGSAAGYSAVHARLKRWFGPASERTCAHCDRVAAEWAYDHKDPNELATDGMAYSTKATHYLPLCRPCHRYMDADHKGKATCGSSGGYYRHRRRGESPCQPCTSAATAVAAERRTRRAVLTEYEERPA